MNYIFEVFTAYPCQGHVDGNNVRGDTTFSLCCLCTFHHMVFSVYISSTYSCSVMCHSLEECVSQHFLGHHHKQTR